MSIKFGKLLSSFSNSAKDFDIIHKVNRFVSNTSTKRILILDSSFNPPHLGHLTLLNESLAKYNDSNEILLLLLIQNADKATPKLDLLENRLNLIYILANSISEKYPSTSINIGLTKHAKFVDKSNAILEELKKSEPIPENLNSPRLTFLLGFDTLIRLFESSYYTGFLSDALGDFMKTTDLFCLTRAFSDSMLENYQLNYLDGIKNGKNPDVPSEWYENILVCENKSDHKVVSSSEIRKSISRGDDDWKHLVIPEIKDYIVENGYYKEN